MLGYQKRPQAERAGSRWARGENGSPIGPEPGEARVRCCPCRGELCALHLGSVAERCCHML